MKRLFITGTDTEIGKTVVSCSIVRGLAAAGYRVAAYKPVASGCEQTDGGLRNEDALALMAAANVALPYDEVNPWAFEPPIAPHIAAAEQGVTIDPQLFTTGMDVGALDYAIIEGVGGWCVPLSPDSMLVDLARACSDAVILVVGMRLGCINHALLSAAAILADKMPLVGWIANYIDDDMLHQASNLEALKQRMPAPLLGEVAFGAQNGNYVIDGSTVQNIIDRIN